MNGRIYRSRRERMLAGVAGGLAELWNMDPSLVRLVWALLVPLTGGLALLAYIVMAIVVPEGEAPPAGPIDADAPADAPVEGRRARPAGSGPAGSGSAQLVIGGILILIGVWFLLEAYVPAFDAGRVWPVALIALGLVILAFGMRGRPSPPPGSG